VGDLDFDSFKVWHSLMQVVHDPAFQLQILTRVRGMSLSRGQSVVTKLGIFTVHVTARSSVRAADPIVTLVPPAIETLPRADLPDRLGSTTARCLRHISQNIPQA